jgi:hypothetical protein
MKLNELIKQLRKLQDEGKGDLQVYARQGSSGSCDPLGTPHVINHVDELGPFDLKKGKEYVSASIRYQHKR